MEVSVLLERLCATGYRATGLGVNAASEAATREAALEGLNRLLRERLADAELVRLEIPTGREEHPWAPLAGRLRDHPERDEIEENMREYRRRMDEQGERL